MNQKEAKIVKLHGKGLSAEEIATRMGYGQAGHLFDQGVRIVNEVIYREARPGCIECGKGNAIEGACQNCGGGYCGKCNYHPDKC